MDSWKAEPPFCCVAQLSVLVSVCISFCCCSLCFVCISDGRTATYCVLVFAFEKAATVPVVVQQCVCVREGKQVVVNAQFRQIQLPLDRITSFFYSNSIFKFLSCSLRPMLGSQSSSAQFIHIMVM